MLIKVLSQDADSGQRLTEPGKEKKKEGHWVSEKERKTVQIGACGVCLLLSLPSHCVNTCMCVHVCVSDSWFLSPLTQVLWEILGSVDTHTHIRGLVTCNSYTLRCRDKDNWEKWEEKIEAGGREGEILFWRKKIYQLIGRAGRILFSTKKEWIMFQRKGVRKETNETYRQRYVKEKKLGLTGRWHETDGDWWKERKWTDDGI